MKKKFTTLTASVLALVMIFTLAGCGTPSGQGVTPGNTGKSGSEPAPQYVYVSSFREGKNERNESVSVACFTEQGFYTTTFDVIGQREPKEGEELEWEGQFDIREESLWFESYDGQRTKLENYEAFAPTPAEGHDGYSELRILTPNENGELAALYYTWESWNDAPAGMDPYSDEYWNYYTSQDTWYLRTMDKTGRELSLTELDFSDAGDWFWAYDMCYTGERILIAGTDALRILNADGSGVQKINVNGYLSDLVTLRDGSVCMVYSDDMTGEMKLGAVDPANGRVTRTWNCPTYAYSFMPGGGDYDLYYQNGINIYGFDLENERAEKIFDWLNVDVMPDNVVFTSRADGSFFGVINTWDSKWENVSTEYVTVVKKAFDEVPQKETLTLGCLWADTDLQNAVVRFNRSSNVRINVVEYNSEEDWSGGTNKLITEIMAGSVPDILALQSMPYQQLAAKGILEDLYPFIDRDSELSREDFLPNVLRAMEVGGKLCSTVTSFSIVTLAGSARVVGDKPGWSVDELRAALDTMPQGCSVLEPYTTSGDILCDELTIDADYYIDWESGEVRFDSKEFIDLLNFAKLFPNYYDWDDHEWDENNSTSARIRDGRQLLSTMYLSTFDDIVSNDAQFGGDMTYIGYPTVSGVGSYMRVYSGYAMSSRCADKDAAWQFLRGFMTEKAMENTYYYDFPANRKLLEKKLTEAMTVEYEKDGEGNYHLDENGERIPVPKGGFWADGMDEPTQFYALTQEQADKVMEVINNTDKLYVKNTTVLNIILEQADAFLTGQKSAEEVARLIQGKMSIYVNEQR